MAAATVAFTSSTSLPEHVTSLGSVLAAIGTWTFTGDYATGGIAIDLNERFKRVGLGKVLYVAPVRGYGLEYDETNKKLKVFITAGVEHTVATLAAALTGTPVAALVIGR